MLSTLTRPVAEVHLEPLAALLVRADDEVQRAFASLPVWDCSAAHLQGRLAALTDAYRAVTGLDMQVSAEQVLGHARATARQAAGGAAP